MKTLTAKQNTLEKRIMKLIIKANYLPFSENDCYPIAKNCVKFHGENPTNKDIEEEIYFYYNN